MIKANELMIGDFVRTNKDVCIKKDTVVEIRSINADRAFPERGLRGAATCVPVDNPDGLSGGVWLEYLDPILLTKDILELNGFKYNDSERGMCGVNAAPFYECEGLPRVWCDGDPFSVWFEEGVNIKYVHQLQHVLRLCGSEKEIKLED